MGGHEQEGGGELPSEWYHAKVPVSAGYRVTDPQKVVNIKVEHQVVQGTRLRVGVGVTGYAQFIGDIFGSGAVPGMEIRALRNVSTTESSSDMSALSGAKQKFPGLWWIVPEVLPMLGPR